MNAQVQIELLPLGRIVSAVQGEPLQDILFSLGVEFPCGGSGRCKGCKIKVLRGTLPVTAEEKIKLKPKELAEGWRLSCRHRAMADLKIELAQWEAAILADDSVFAFTPQAGLGVAVDLGTTTLVAQLLDLSTGHVLAIRTSLNPQAKHGADIMSRIEFALAGKQDGLTDLIRHKIGQMVEELLIAASRNPMDLRRVVIVGNTVMYHFFCALDVEPLSHDPFEPRQGDIQTFTVEQLGWPCVGNPTVSFLPCLGSFVGSDILAGVLATKLHQGRSLQVLIDLGTNGEIVVGNSSKMLCASTAAGPAFEGARIANGMRAATGAISEVHVRDGKVACRVLGNTEPRGICGSGLVDAAAVGLDLGVIQASGRLNQVDSMPLSPQIALQQSDIRELQLAKGAIAAGVDLLLQQWGATAADVSHVFLAGAFGNYINRASARRIGLLKFPLEKIQPVGNSALLGCKLALFSESLDSLCAPIGSRMAHVCLNDRPDFQEVYVGEMAFPDQA